MKFKLTFLIIIFSIVYFLTRLLYIDSDIPVWELSHYAPVDEFYYTQNAFDMVEGIHTPTGKYLDSEFNFIYNIFQQILTSTSLIIFGDTYLGLRLPSVISGFSVFWIFIVLFHKRFGTLEATVFALVLITDFGFTLSNRIAEPTIFRIAAYSIVILIILEISQKEFLTQKKVVGLPIYPLVISVLCTSACVFVYPTNAFLIFAGLIYAISYKGFEKIKRKSLSSFIYSLRFVLLSYLLGIIISFLIYLFIIIFFDFTFDSLIYIWQMFNANIWQMFNGRTIIGDSNPSYIIRKILTNIYLLKEANFFRLNPYFFFVVVVVLSLFTLHRLKFMCNFLRTNQKTSKQTLPLDSGYFKNLNKSFYNYHCDKLIFSTFFSFLFQCMFINDHPQRKLVAILPILVYVLVYILSKLQQKSVSLYRLLLILVFLPVILTQLNISYPKIYTDPTYSHKEVMETLQVLDGEPLIGGFSMGFRLYNETKPFLNVYQFAYTEERLEALRAEMLKHTQSGYVKYSISDSNPATKSAMATYGFGAECILRYSNDPIYYDDVLYKWDGKTESGENTYNKNLATCKTYFLNQNKSS